MYIYTNKCSWCREKQSWKALSCSVRQGIDHHPNHADWENYNTRDTPPPSHTHPQPEEYCACLGFRNVIWRLHFLPVKNSTLLKMVRHMVFGRKCINLTQRILVRKTETLPFLCSFVLTPSRRPCFLPDGCRHRSRRLNTNSCDTFVWCQSKHIYMLRSHKRLTTRDKIRIITFVQL